MKASIFGAFAALFSVFWVQAPLHAQDAAKAPSAYVSVTGSVTKVDAAAKVISVKTDKGDTAVKFDDKTQFLALGPGETDLTKAAPMKPEDLTAGDRILARVRAADPTGLPATRAIINRQSDIAKRDARTLEDWRTQSVAGLVGAVDASAKTITMKVRGATPAAPVKEVTIDVSGKVTYERFSADTGRGMNRATWRRFARSDQIRVLGEQECRCDHGESCRYADRRICHYSGTNQIALDAGTMEVSRDESGNQLPASGDYRQEFHSDEAPG